MKRLLTLTIIVSLLVSLIGCGDIKSEDTEVENTVKKTSTEEPVAKETDAGVMLNTEELVLPAESEERLQVETGAAMAINYYLAARAYLDMFLQYDIESGNAEEYEALLNKTLDAFNKVDEISSNLATSAGELESLEAKRDLLPEMIIGLENPFVVKVYAAEESEAVKWAKDITERFDKAPAGKGIRTLAEQMGTDAKHAYAQLKQAQDILASDAYSDFADTANAAYKTAMALKTAGTAAQLTLSIVTANPGTMTEAVLQGGGILMNGINTMLEVGQTSSVLIVGEDNKLSAKLENIESALAPIGATVGLFSLGSNLMSGKELLDDVPAMADSIMYMGSSLYDYMSEGKILGGTFTQADNGTISVTLSDTMTIKNQWAKNPKEAEEILKAVGYTESEIAEIKDTQEAEVTPFDQFANISPKVIGSILEEVAPVASDVVAVSDIDMLNSTGDVSNNTNEDASEGTLSEVQDENQAEGQNENIGETDETDETDETSEEINSIPDISELAGTYNFYTYMTIGDQSAEGEVPQTVAVTGGNTLSMTDDYGCAIYGTYDSSTGVAVFADSDGTAVKVTFSRNDNGKIHAKLRLFGDGFSMSGDTDKL